MTGERLSRLNGMGYLDRVASGEIPPHKHARTPIPPPERSLDAELVNVLLVGGTNIGFSPLSESLEKSGYHCEFVATCLDGARLVARASFDLVLCSGRTKGFQLLLSAARRSSASLFRCLLVEDGCWWVPTVVRGEPCSCVPAFRDTEFAKALDTMVKEVKSASPNAKAMAAASGNGSDGNGSNGKLSNR